MSIRLLRVAVFQCLFLKTISKPLHKDTEVPMRSCCTAASCDIARSQENQSFQASSNVFLTRNGEMMVRSKPQWRVLKSLAQLQ